MAWKDWSFDRYRKEVDRLTMPHKGKIVFPNDDGIYEVDHRLQVKLAFNIGIDPRIVANPINLRYLQKDFNASRQDTPDRETIAAINQLIDKGFLTDNFRPKTYTKIEYKNHESINYALKDLSVDNPIAQAHIELGVLSSIPAIESQRLHETRYGKQLLHFVKHGSIRPQHRRFTAHAWPNPDGTWELRLGDGNTRKENILQDYLMFYNLEFPPIVTLDIMFAENEEQANKDALLLDAAGASKSAVDIQNGYRRMKNLLGGINVERLNNGKGWMNIVHAVYHGTPYQLQNKEDIGGFCDVLEEFTEYLRCVVNDFITDGRPVTNTPAGFQELVIAAMIRFKKKYGVDGDETLHVFTERRKNHSFGDRDSMSPALFAITQPISVILDEITKYSETNVNEIQKLRTASVTGFLPRRILPNTSSDANFKIIAGLITYALEASMNRKVLNEDLYKEFIGEYSSDLEPEEIRALAINKVEDYFDDFWNN